MRKIRARLPRLGLIGIGAIAAAALIPAFAFAVGAPDPDVNNAGVFELDGDVTHEAATTPPYDWSNLFTSTGARIQVADLINSSFVADPTTNDFAFISGASKDNIDTSNWLCTSKPVTPKDEIQNSYAAAFIAPSTSPVAGHVLVYMALERGTVSGTSNAGFWIFKQPMACDPTTGTFINPNTGLRATHTDGDILLFASFTSGGTSATVQLFTWSTATGGLVGPTTGQDCATSTTNLCGISNAFNPITTPWAPGTVGTNGFFEAGIDLTSTLPTALQSSCFSTILADTRSSASVTADLHDFNAGSFSLCKTPVVKTTQSPSSGTVNSTSFSDSATVSGAAGNLAGETVTFKLFNNATCTGTPAFTTTGILSAGSPAGTWVASTSSSFTPKAAGTYYWVAFYPGDRSSGGLNQAASSGCGDEPIVVNPVTPTLTTSASASVSIGNPISDNATLGGTTPEPGGSPAAGSIIFTAFNAAGCANTALVFTSSPFSVSGNGFYGPATFTPKSAGTYYWIATYTGDLPNTNGVSTKCGDTGETSVVNPVTPTLTTSATAGPVVVLSPIDDTAHLTGTALETDGTTPAKGTITFNVYGPFNATGICTGAPLGTSIVSVSGDSFYSASSGTITGTLIPTAPGTYNWVAAYSGDLPNTNPVSSGCGDANESSIVIKLPSMITTSQSWYPNDSATIGGGGTGNVTFTLYLNNMCTSASAVVLGPITVPVSNGGAATNNTTFAITSVTAGDTYWWGAAYSGDATHKAVSSCVESTGFSSLMNGSTVTSP